jgi:thymidylate synthase (FAD)
MESKCFDPLGDGKSKLQLIMSMGDDLTIVNDAKASFERESTEFGEKERKLLNYLLTANPPHTSPLRGVVFKFKVKAPLATCRQWFKHVIASNHNDEQLGWNEKSFRYTQVKDDADFYIPQQWGLQAKDNKQGTLPEKLNDFDGERLTLQCFNSAEFAYRCYEQIINAGVSRDEARLILPPCFYTSWVWTASLQAVLHFIDLRTGASPSLEIVKYAECVKAAIADVVPETLMIIQEHRKNN